MKQQGGIAMIVRKMTENANPLRLGAVENIRRQAKEQLQPTVQKEGPAQRMKAEVYKGNRIDTKA